MGNSDMMHHAPRPGAAKLNQPRREATSATTGKGGKEWSWKPEGGTHKSKAKLRVSPSTTIRPVSTSSVPVVCTRTVVDKESGERWQEQYTVREVAGEGKQYGRSVSGPNRASATGKQSVRSENFGGWGKGPGNNVSDTNRGVNAVLAKEDARLDAKLGVRHRDKVWVAPITSSKADKRARRKAKNKREAERRKDMGKLATPNSAWSKLYAENSHSCDVKLHMPAREDMTDRDETE